MNYRVGDKIRIKSKKWYNSLKNFIGSIDSEIVDFGFNIYMSKQCGKIGIITNVVDTIYRGKKIKKYFLNLDDGMWTWGKDMFEPYKNMLEIE